MRALITGINGMDGSHLADLLLEKGYEVYGMERRTSSPNRTNTKHLEGKITFLNGDLTDQNSLVRCLKESNPNEVYNLGAMSFVGESWNTPEQTSDVTGLGVLRMLEAIREYGKEVKFYQASSSEMFGRMVENPAKESTPFYPRSPYGVAKLYGHWITKNYRESYDMFACSGILFNHESERRGIEFVTRKITDGVARIHLGLQDKITLGNLEAKRDWGYSPDYCEAMWLMLQQDSPDDYVIATNETHSIREFLDLAFERVGITDWKKYVGQDPRFMRPAEVDVLRGDSTKAQTELGWKPKTPFKQLVYKMVDNDIEKLKKMIKIKLSDSQNIKCFSGLILSKDMLNDYSIQLTDSNDYDYEFLGSDEFLNLSLPLNESIDWGLENISKKTGDYFLFHGGDSTSILGAYEVFTQSNAKYLFKKQLLSKEDYEKKTTLNKWFFGNGSILDRGYDISDETYSKIKLTGYNVAHNWPHLQQMHIGNDNRDIDVCAVYQGILNNGNMDHELRSDVLYTKHRKTAWDELSKIEDKYNIVKGQSTPQQFVEVMKRSKVGLSPFGMGELCYRDLELIQWGCLLIKPDMSKVLTEPDFFKPMETYIPVKPDWSDLNETIEKVLGNFKDYSYIVDNARKKVVEMYSYQNVCMYWYNFFSNLNGVKNA